MQPSVSPTVYRPPSSTGKPLKFAEAVASAIKAVESTIPGALSSTFTVSTTSQPPVNVPPAMTERGGKPAWYVEPLDERTVERFAVHYWPYADPVAMGVDVVGDPHRESDDGYNWTLLSYARNVAYVAPGSAVVMGSAVGRYIAKVIVWIFQVSDDDPIVVLELVPLMQRRIVGS